MSSAPALDEANLKRFRERVQRVESNAVVTHKVNTQVRVQKEKVVKVRRRASSPATFLIALLTGALAVVVARYARAVYADGTLIGTDGQTTMMIDFGLALFAALVLRAVLALPGTKLFFVQLVGIAVMVVSMQDLVHMAPDLWARAFPQEWVADVLSETKPNSILFKGQTYSL